MRRPGLFVVPALAALALAVAPAALAETTTLTAVMTAEEEVPEPGPAGAKGTAEITIDEAAGQLCYKLAYEGIPEPTAAHIHEGGAGTAGPVVVDLDIVKNGPEACVPADAGELGHIAGDPGGHYVNVHTADYPKGAMRGQLSAG